MLGAKTQKKEMAAGEGDPSQPLWKGAASPHFCVSAGNQAASKFSGRWENAALMCNTGRQDRGHRDTSPGRGSLSPVEASGRTSPEVFGGMTDIPRRL